MLTVHIDPKTMAVMTLDNNSYDDPPPGAVLFLRLVTGYGAGEVEVEFWNGRKWKFAPEIQNRDGETPISELYDLAKP